MYRAKLNPRQYKSVKHMTTSHNLTSFEDEMGFQRARELSVKATLWFTERAWLKMWALVRNFNEEVAWHGVVSRSEKENEYVVTDIVVYPQTVSGASVEMDVDEYGKWMEWLSANFEDKRFNHLHLQGHSHVNMGVFPSETDLKHQEDIVVTLRKNSFYIFVIWNKRNSHNIRIFDKENNIFFDNEDVVCSIIPEDSGVLKFLREAKMLVKDQKRHNEEVSEDGSK